MTPSARALMPGQRSLTIFGGTLWVTFSLAFAETQQQGQQQVLRFSAGENPSGGGGDDRSVVSKRYLRGSSGAALSEAATTTTMAAKMAVAVSDFSLRDRSGEAAAVPMGKRARGRGRGFGFVGIDEAAAARGGTVGAKAAGVADGPDGTPEEESERNAARAREVKQGSRGSNERDDGGVEDDTSSQSIAVVALCIGAATLFLIGWCWLSSVVVCVSWCVCKCVKRGPSSSSSLSGDRHGKYVDTYANAVQATFCGDLANVVCVSHDAVTVNSDGDGHEPVPPSQPSTPDSSGNGLTHGSSISGSKRLNGAAAHSSSAMDGERNSPSRASSSTYSSASSSTFSAIFRRSLTATAVAHVTPTAQDDNNKNDNGGTPFFLSATAGGEIHGGGGDVSLFSPAEEKRSEATGTDSAVVQAARTPRPAERHGVRFSGGPDERCSWAGGRNVGGGAMGSPTPANPERSWRSRLLARIGATVRGSAGGFSSPVDLQDPAAEGTGAAEVGGINGQPSQTNVLPSTDGSSARSLERSFADVGRCSGADDTVVSHRRRVGSRAGSQGRGVGSRAVGGGCSGSSEGHTYGCTTPAVSPEAGENSNGRSSRSSSSRSSSTTADGGNNNYKIDLSGRENDGVAAVSGSEDAAGVFLSTATSTVRSHGEGAPERVQSAVPAELGTTAKSAEVGSSANDRTAQLPAANAAADVSSGCRDGGGGREGEARPASGIGERSEATAETAETSRGSSVPREESGIAEPRTASRGSVGGAAAAVATAPARSSYLASPEARARNRNHSEAEGADDNAAGEGGRTKQSRQQPPQGGRGEDSCRTSRSGDTQPEPLALPRARVLWRAFSEVDHEKIGENHRLAALSHQARFGPIPGVRNSPVCRVLV